jgi:hypothetical protein
MESEPGSSFLFEHDLFQKPVPTPDQVGGRLFRDHALDKYFGRSSRVAARRRNADRRLEFLTIDRRAII